jgi:hypothetical protein
MSDNDFWVHPDGLRRSAEGFTDKKLEINSISARITALTDPSRVADATGGDSGGREFSGVHLNMASQLHEGVRAWSTATDATGGGLRHVARAFTTVEDNATFAAKTLHRNVTADPPASQRVRTHEARLHPIEPAIPGVPVESRVVEP